MSSKTGQTSKVESFAKIVNSLCLLFARNQLHFRKQGDSLKGFDSTASQNMVLSLKMVFQKEKHFQFYQRRIWAAATSTVERFVIIVNGWKQLTIITKRCILDVAAALDPPLIAFVSRCQVMKKVSFMYLLDMQHIVYMQPYLDLVLEKICISFMGDSLSAKTIQQIEHKFPMILLLLSELTGSPQQCKQAPINQSNHCATIVTLVNIIIRDICASPFFQVGCKFIFLLRKIIWLLYLLTAGSNSE